MNQQQQAGGVAGAAPPDPMMAAQQPPIPPGAQFYAAPPPPQAYATQPPPWQPQPPQYPQQPPPQACTQQQAPMHCYPAQAYCCPPPQYPPQAYHCYTQPQHCPPANPCAYDPCTQNSAMEEYCKQIMRQAMGDQAGMFDDLLGKLGMEDKEFWKGAMIGAAAVLLLTNDKVKDTLTSTLASAGEMFKSGTGMVKDAATDSAEIMKDTVKGGAESFSESVARHKARRAESDDSSESDNGSGGE